MSEELREPDESGAIPRVVASLIEVFVNESTLETPGPTSYHEREGCYNADDVVPWPVAIDHEAEPCGRCCESFELDGDAA